MENLNKVSVHALQNKMLVRCSDLVANLSALENKVNNNSGIQSLYEI